MRYFLTRFLFSRQYRVSDVKMTWDQGFDFCDSVGMGLALWNTDTAYTDLKWVSITHVTCKLTCKALLQVPVN